MNDVLEYFEKSFNTNSDRSRNFERGFQLDKKTSPLQPDQRRLIVNSFFSHFSPTETSLASSTTLKPTHCPQLMHDKAILALCTTNHSQIGACTLSERVSTETIVTPLYLSLTKLFTIYLFFHNHLYMYKYIWDYRNNKNKKSRMHAYVIKITC